jgi:hypothetical protein
LKSTSVVESKDQGLRLARLLLLVFMLFNFTLYIAGSVLFLPYASSHLGEYTAYSWTPDQMNHILSRIGIGIQWWIGYQWIASVIGGTIFYILAALIFVRKSTDWFGLYVSITFVLFAGAISGYGNVLIAAHPELKTILTPLGVLAWPLFFLMFYLFPDGHFIPLWTRWAAVVMMLVFGIVLFVYGGDQPPAPYILTLLVILVIGVGSQIYRYRKVSNALERQQTKWVILAIILLVGTLALTMIPLVIPGAMDPNSPMALFLIGISAASSIVFILIPLSVGFAILRYRLWDVDVIIRKTLVYSALTVTLALVFLGIIIFLQRFLGKLTGVENSPIAIVVSTLVIATLFNPLRIRIQNGIDRRFYRKKYDAQKMLERFTYAARNEVELDQITERLLAVVDETMQPVSIGLWVKKIQSTARKSETAR